MTTKFNQMRKHLRCAIIVKAGKYGYRKCGKQATGLVHFYKHSLCPECEQEAVGYGKGGYDPINIPMCDKHIEFFFTGHYGGGSYTVL